MITSGRLASDVSRLYKKTERILVTNFKIRRIIEYPEREEEGGGRERVEWKVGSLGIQDIGFVNLMITSGWLASDVSRLFIMNR